LWEREFYYNEQREMAKIQGAGAGAGAEAKEGAQTGKGFPRTRPDTSAAGE
jgi:hypothetical protein